MTRFVIAALMVCALGAGACSKDPEVAKREYLSSGDAYFAEKKYAEAVVEYRNAIQQDPRFGLARFKLAETYVELRQPRDAYREYIRAADLLPDNLESQIKAGRMLLAGRNFIDAQSRADKALAIDPKSVDAHLIKAAALGNMQQVDEAVKQVESAIQSDPTQSGSYIGLGALEVARGNTAAAEAAFKQAIETSPDSIPAHLGYANFLWINRRVEEAGERLKIAQQLDPKNTNANRALAAFYFASGQPAAAEAPLKTIVDVTGTGESRLALASYYIASNRLDDARGILEELAKGTDANAAEAITRLAALEVRQNRRPEALKLIEQAIQKQPKDSRALAMKAEILLMDGKADEALVAATAATATDEALPYAHLIRGRVLAAKFEFKDAIASYNRALQLAPAMVRAQVDMAKAMLASGDVDGAAQAARAAIKATTVNPEAQLVLARAMLAKGDTGSADAAMKVAAAAAPNASLVHAQLGMLQSAKGDRVGARASYERALKVNPNQVDALSGLMVLDVREGQPARARARIDQRLAAEPKNVALLLLAANTYASLGDIAAAEPKLRDAIAADPGNLLAYQMLGRVYALQGKLDDARREFEAVTRRVPGSVGATTMVALLYEMQNNTESAKEWYQRALAIDSKAAVASNNLAWLTAETGGNLDVALQLAQTAKSRLADRPEVSDTIGWVYYKKGMSTLAISAFQESIALDPKRATYHYHLGLAHIANGDKLKAKDALLQALRLQPGENESAAVQKALASISS